MTGSLGWHVWLGTIITIVPATVAVGARFLARWLSAVGFKADDWTIFAALIMDWVMAAVRFYGLLYDGLGYHAATLPHGTIEDYQKSFLAVQIAYFSTAVLTKMSILLLYGRLFGIYKYFRIAVYILEGLVICYFIVCVVIAIAGCQPVSYFWNKDQDGSCLNEVQFFRWNGVTNLILDVVILALPIPMVWNLHLRLKQKFVLSGIFLIGGFACLSSILRIAQFQKSKQSDPTYTTVDSGMWSSVEQSLGILCACLPTLRPLLHGRFWGDTKNSYSGPIVPPYLSHSSYELSLGRTNNTTGVWRTWPGSREMDTESQVAIKSDPSFGPATTSVRHDDEKSLEGRSSPQDLRTHGIVITSEITQDVASLRHEQR